MRLWFILLISFLFLAVLVPSYLYNFVLFSPLSCQWKFPEQGTTTAAADSQLNAAPTPTRIVLIADPQMEGDGRVLREGTYGQLNNDFNDWYFWLIQHNINRFLKPEYEYVLGDLFSSQYLSVEEYNVRHRRYHANFGVNRTITKQFHLAGNHDTGYGAEIRLTPHKLARFKRYFGSQEHKEESNGHLLVHLNSLVLDKSPLIYEGDDENETWRFLHTLVREQKEKQNPLPVILFTHIPLYKEKQPHCGDEYMLERLDENGYVHEQTMLTPETSKYILDELKPLFIFNGHDHHGCSYKHNNTVGTMEYTVRTIMGDHGGYFGLFEFVKDNSSENAAYSYQFKSCSFVESNTIVFWLACCLLWVLIVALYCSGKVLFGMLRLCGLIKKTSDKQKTKTE